MAVAHCPWLQSARDHRANQPNHERDEEAGLQQCTQVPGWLLWQQLHYTIEQQYEWQNADPAHQEQLPFRPIPVARQANHRLGSWHFLYARGGKLIAFAHQFRELVGMLPCCERIGRYKALKGMKQSPGLLDPNAATMTVRICSATVNAVGPVAELVFCSLG